MHESDTKPKQSSFLLTCRPLRTTLSRLVRPRELLGLNYAMRLSALTLQMNCQAQEVAALLAAPGDEISSTSEARPTGAPGTSG